MIAVGCGNTIYFSSGPAYGLENKFLLNLFGPQSVETNAYIVFLVSPCMKYKNIRPSYDNTVIKFQQRPSFK